jgi:hypothetical protein
MLVITIMLSILGIVVGLLKFETLNERSLSEPRADHLMIGVQIICGDCSGDAERPLKTYVDRNGNCAQCGGRSFMLASNRIVYGHQLMISCLSDQKHPRAFNPPKPEQIYTASASVN